MLAASWISSNDVDCFAGHVTFGLGDGNQIPFWHGRWCGGSHLKGLFPSLFNLCSKKLATVKEIGAWNGWVWSWDFHVPATALLDYPVAMAEALELFEILTVISPTEGGVDSYKWWPNAEGSFTVKSCYNLLRDRHLKEMVDEHTMAAIKRIWGTAIPSRIKVFG